MVLDTISFPQLLSYSDSTVWHDEISTVKKKLVLTWIERMTDHIRRPILEGNLGNL